MRMLRSSYVGGPVKLSRIVAVFFGASLLILLFQNCSGQSPSVSPLEVTLPSVASPLQPFSVPVFSFNQTGKNIDVNTAFAQDAKKYCEDSPLLCGSVQGVVSDDKGQPFNQPGAVVSLREPTQLSFPFGATSFQQPLPAGKYEMGISIPDGYDVYVSACRDCVDHPESSYALYGHAGGGTLAPFPLEIGAGGFIDVRWRFKRNTSALSAVDQGLTCNFPGLGIPEATDAAKFIGKDAVADIGISRNFGGVATRFNLINRERPDQPLQILEARSAAGSAWQSAYMAYDAPSAKTLVVNQAAGNMMQQWGYAGTYANGSSGLSQVGWNPMFTDHLHPVIDGQTQWLTSEKHSPCFNMGYRFDDGQSKIVGGSRATALGNVAEFDNALSLRATVNQNWSWWAIDQALYLDKAAARKGDLRVYVPPVESSVTPAYVRPYDGFSLAGAKEAAVRADQSHYSFKSHPVPYVILIWKVAGKDLALAVHPSVAGQKFEAFLILSKNALECGAEDLAKLGDACGNIEFHAYAFNSQLLPNSKVNFKMGDTRTYSMRYTLGTPDQLRQLGFALP